MKATVTINSRGVVTLPAKLRQALGLKADDVLIAETTPEGLLPPLLPPPEVIAQEIARRRQAWRCVRATCPSSLPTCSA
jgi:bifunctional DNA-binding transcriptional regulator/antitoxin component of YhaV-PrlF toxin-antitoxin module